MLTIAVGSKSALKLATIRQVVAELGLEAEVVAVEAGSGVPNQPYTALTTLMGAKYRAAGVRRRHPSAYALAIENGLVPQNGRHVDLAYVALITPDGKRFSRTSGAVPVPEELVEASRKSEWKVTAGELEAARSGCDPADPHRVWSGGKTDRATLLADAVREILLAALNAEKENIP